jgi:UDP-3-O-[3-hydroxymyristoyl] glucosamine N-acyltransferase
MTGREIVDFLRSLDGVEVRIPPGLNLDALAIQGVTTDANARPGDLAWISEKVAAEEPDRISGFRGTILIAPLGAVEKAPPVCIVCGAREPKAAFTAVFDRFFDARSSIQWPAGAHHLSPDTRVGEAVAIAVGVVFGPGVTIGNRVTIGPNTVLANTRIGDDVSIGANCTIGLAGFGYAKTTDGEWKRFPHVGGVTIESGVEIGSNTCIDRGALGDTVIRRGAKIDNLVHIAHNCDIGENALIIANAMIGGSTTIGAGAWVAPSAAVNNKLTIGAAATVGTGAVVVKNVDADSVVVGNPARTLERKQRP